MNEIQFDRRLKLLAKILFFSNLLDLFFYDPTKPLGVNALNLAIPMGFGALVAWGIHAGKNWARALVYFGLVLGLISAMQWPDMTLWQKGAFTLGLLIFAGIVYQFHRYPALTSQYFQAGSMKKKWRIVLIALGACVILLFGTITLAGLYFRQQGATLMTEMKNNLVLEGNVDPKVMATCQEKFSRKIENAAILDKFCQCFSLNMDKVTATGSGSFVTRSVALTMACWPAEAPPMKGVE